MKIDTEADGAISAPEHEAIINAFRFVEDVWSQTQALRKTLESQVISHERLRALGLSVGKFVEDYECTDDSCMNRSIIDAFDLYFARKKGRRVPVIHCAFQISLAPVRKRADANFFPHVAILLATATENDSWDCEEYQLDYEYLAEIEDEGNKWERTSQRRWKGSKNEDVVAFVVPLGDLRNDQDTEREVVKPFFAEVENMLKYLNQVELSV
ncbi:MAG: hypothetical protein EOP06_08810 [Proteobacteria bacterium]|nr:MAG: hypothetical protein EOP06_08810 [Pseudomonadota bacterium]